MCRAGGLKVADASGESRFVLKKTTTKMAIVMMIYDIDGRIRAFVEGMLEDEMDELVPRKPAGLLSSHRDGRSAFFSATEQL